MGPTKEDNPTKTRIEYTEVELKQVIQFFVNGYSPKDGQIINHETFVDTAKGKVIMKLYIQTPIKT